MSAAAGADHARQLPEGADAASPLLEIRGLRVSFTLSDGRRLTAVDGINLSVAPGEAVGLAGESGSGKSTAVGAIMGLLAPNGRIDAGSIRYRGLDLAAKGAPLRRTRWREIAVVFQGSLVALNPVIKVRDQVAEAIELRLGEPAEVAQEKAKLLLHDVGIPEKRINAYPHQFSGGQRQRAMLAVALSCSPAVLIGDEPTTALDVIVQAQILELLDRMRQEYGLGLILITHDLAVIADMCDRVAIMYAGRIVESGSVKEIFSAPRHPYTQALLGAAPDARAGRRTIKVLEGHPPDLSALPPGCHFAPRCPLADARCREEDPPTIEYADRVTLACHRYSLGDGKLPTPIDAPYPTLELGKR